jgi:hypothetical protein
MNASQFRDILRARHPDVSLPDTPEYRQAMSALMILASAHSVPDKNAFRYLDMFEAELYAAGLGNTVAALLLEIIHPEPLEVTHYDQPE